MNLINITVRSNHMTRQCLRTSWVSFVEISKSNQQVLFFFKNGVHPIQGLRGLWSKRHSFIGYMWGR